MKQQHRSSQLYRSICGNVLQDTSGLGRPADFDYFEYDERDYQPHNEEL
jgi:beta-xylosidase